MADDPMKPYGDVAYADPGYQDDGKKRYPLDSEEHCRAAWSYINQEKNAAKYTSEQLARIRARIKAAGEKYGIQFGAEAGRSAPMDRPTYEREWALDDIIIRAGGDGRTVEAYAAIFNSPAEIRDQHGHYMEEIDRTAFNRTLSHGIDRVGVYYHHGMTIHGTPSDLGSVPIGRPVSVRADQRGLLTVTRYNKSQLADSVLEAIRNGDIKGYSFRGSIIRSNPNRPPRVRPGASLPMWRHLELGLREYGPTPTPAYADAGILAMRSTLDEIREELASLSRNITSPTPLDPDDDDATPDLGPGAEDPRDAHSARQQQRLRLRSRAKFLGV